MNSYRPNHRKLNTQEVICDFLTFLCIGSGLVSHVLLLSVSAGKNIATDERVSIVRALDGWRQLDSFVGPSVLHSEYCGQRHWSCFLSAS
jgi:hypothetical protein